MSAVLVCNCQRPNEVAGRFRYERRDLAAELFVKCFEFIGFTNQPF